MPANKLGVEASTRDRQRDDSHLNLKLRAPTVEDAHAICELVCDSDVLDSNSLYCYLLLCRHFAETCLVGVIDDEVIAFVSAYRPPNRPDSIFVWQIAVAGSHQRHGLGSKLLNALTGLRAVQSCSFIEATVTPSNQASLRMFQRLAERLNAPLETVEGFAQDLFGSEESSNAALHEEERLIRIGPLVRKPHFSLKSASNARNSQREL